MTAELRYLQTGSELRSAAGGRELQGYAATFGATANLGDFRERLKPGAFARAIRERQDVIANINHSSDKVLGRTTSGTLKLAEDSRGLHFKVQLGNASYARDLADAVARGDISSCSFAFRVAKGGEKWERVEGQRLRTLTDVDLIDVSVVTFPAYSSTSVSIRAALGADFRVGIYGTPAASISPEAGLDPDEVERLRQRLRLRKLGL